MPRESEHPLEKVTLNLVAGDRDILTSHYPGKGWSVAAREIIHIYCRKLREAIDPLSIDIHVDLSSLEKEQDECLTK